jgi:hypothetical protein
VTTYRTDDGAPAGEYGVLIAWRKARPEGQEPEDEDDDLLQGRYNDPGKPAWRVEIKQEPNPLPPFVVK